MNIREPEKQYFDDGHQRYSGYLYLDGCWYHGIYQPGDAKALWIATHVLTEESLVEVVMTSWHWSVNSIELEDAGK